MQLFYTPQHARVGDVIPYYEDGKLESSCYYKENELNYNLKQKLLWSRKIVTSFYKKNQADISKGNFSF